MGVVTLLVMPNELSAGGRVKEWSLQLSGLSKDDFDTLNLQHPFATFALVAGYISAKWFGKGEGHREGHPPMGHVTAIFNHLENFGYDLPACRSRSVIDTGCDEFKGLLWTLHKPK